MNWPIWPGLNHACTIHQLATDLICEKVYQYKSDNLPHQFLVFSAHVSSFSSSVFTVAAIQNYTVSGSNNIILEFQQ
jgi:hypothetical protein